MSEASATYLLQGHAVLIPPELEPARAAALQALGRICPATTETKADKDLLFSAVATAAGRDLPAYYLVYFLLIDLLGFGNLGRSEKIAWSIPIDFDGQAFLIEFRKFGIGLYGKAGPDTETQAVQIVNLVKASVDKAHHFFAWLADRAVQSSTVNVVNRSRLLFERFEFHLGEHKRVADEALARAGERSTEKPVFKGTKVSDYYLPAYKLSLEARWLGLAAIEAFFSWTEHVFIHFAILRGKVTTGVMVAVLAEDNWPNKFKTALDLSDKTTKRFYDELLGIRNQFRNFNAHGAFGKQREAFDFHSGTGAVPVRLRNKPEEDHFVLGAGVEIAEAKALKVIEEFIEHLRTSEFAPALLYVLESDLPSILTHTTDGTYKKALTSVEEMQKLVGRLGAEFDRCGNMDW